ncbi:MAG: outer membrane lipoprotein carrier protein LolA [Nibricoccus sp.]
MFLRLLSLFTLHLSLFTLRLPAADVAELMIPANRIVVGENDAAWRELSATLAANGNVTGPFTENRYLPFKKIPVVFTGDMRLSPEHGLSLAYTKPESQLMIVDAKGVLLRDGRGRQRELPNDPRAQAATTALLHVMRFDFPELSKNFEVFGLRNGDDWQLVFDPRPGELANVLNRLVVTGRGAAVKKLEMRKSALQGIEILIGDVRTHVEFTPEEIEKILPLITANRRAIPPLCPGCFPSQKNLFHH